MTNTTRPDGVAEIVRRLQACVDDPMWANHAEVNKATLRAAISALTAQASNPTESTDQLLDRVDREVFFKPAAPASKPAEGGPTDDQIWNLRGLSPFDATTETREEFIIRARAALAREGGE
jgi:hypothetical protein